MYILANKKWVHENRPVRLRTDMRWRFYCSPLYVVFETTCGSIQYDKMTLLWYQNDITEAVSPCGLPLFLLPPLRWKNLRNSEIFWLCRWDRQGPFMAIFKIVDKSEFWSCYCSGRMVWEFGEGKLGGRGRDVWWDEILTIILVVARYDFGVWEARFGVNLRGNWEEGGGCEVMILILRASKVINKKRYNLVLVLVSIWYEKRWFYGLNCSRCMKILHQKTLENTGQIKVFSSPRQKRSTLLI